MTEEKKDVVDIESSTEVVEEKVEEKVEVVEEEKVDVDELVERVATLEQDKVNVVEEMTGLRKKNQTLTAELQTALDGKKEVVETNDDIDSKVKAILEEDSKKKAVKNRGTAVGTFQNKCKEFHPDNDPGGAKMSLLEEKVKLFNSEGLIEEKEFVSLYERAMLHIPKKTVENKETISNPFTSTPQGGGSPSVAENNQISSVERKLIQSKGWTEERYLKLKNKQPRFIEELLKLTN